MIDLEILKVQILKKLMKTKIGYMIFELTKTLFQNNKSINPQELFASIMRIYFGLYQKFIFYNNKKKFFLITIKSKNKKYVVLKIIKR